MMKRILLVVAVLLLGACTHPAVREFNAWSAAEKPRAERGEIKWSDYYKEGYDKISKSPDSIPSKGTAMDITNFMITAALAYESGKIDKDTFDGMRRNMEAQWQKVEEANAAAARAHWGEALQNYGNTVYGPGATRAQQLPTQPLPTYQPPKQISCQTIGFQTTCTEQ